MVPRKVGSIWEICAPAKLNLYLEVLGRRVDGFHRLETLMVSVRIFDQLRWSSAAHREPSSSLRVQNLLQADDSTKTLLPDNGDNIVLHAAEKLASTAGVEPTGRFELIKRIPLQAGLGGGSSDAAATLLLANTCWGINYSQQRLAKLAEELGSDVPFFLAGRPAVCRGRGEKIEPIVGLPRLNFVVVKPPVGLSTAAVFDQFSKRTTAGASSAPSTSLASLLESLRRGSIADAGQWMINQLEAAAEKLSPGIDRLRTVFAESGCYGHFMTGSGSGYVGVMRSARHARRTAHRISGLNLGNVFTTSSC